LGQSVRSAMQLESIPRYEQSDALDRLYAKTDAFLYETLVWNRCPTKQAMRQRIIATLAGWQMSGSRILVFGDGLGFDCAALSLCGHAVTYFEIGTLSLGFARHVFALNQVPVTVCQSLDDLSTEAFDAIVCLDVLEHLPNPPELVKKLVNFLRPGGVFFSHAPFAYLHPCVGTHLRSNAQYSGEWRRLYGASGLVPVDGVFFWNPVVLEKKGGAMPRHFAIVQYLFWQGGGWLLWLFRFWPWPYTQICRMIAAGESARLLAPEKSG